MARPDRSVVIPVYQEVQSAPRLHEALARVAGAAPGAWEFIFVDDGSRDGTWEALCALQAQDARVRVIRLKRNFGQTAAMAEQAGLQQMALQGFGTQASDGLEVFEVAGQERGAATERGCRNQGVSDRDGVSPAKVTGQLSDVGRRRHARQQLQKLGNSPFISWSQRRAGQQFAFCDDRNRGSYAPAFYVAQEPARCRLAPQVVDQDIGVNEVLGHLRVLAFEPSLPFASQAALVGEAVRHAPTQQTGGLIHNAACDTASSARPGLGQSHDPLDRLQLVLQPFNLVCDRGDFHRPQSTICVGERQTCRPLAAVEESDGAP